MSDNDELNTMTLQPATVPGGSMVDFLEALDLEGTPIAVRERIRLRGLHSSGGIGEVWRAYDEVLEREIALKRLKVDMAVHEGNRARFFREAKITGRLDHPGIVPIYDYSTDVTGNHCFYTMRFLRGRTLREVSHAFHGERVAAGRPLVCGEFLRLLGYFISVCNTIAFAHSRRIIHRDLKGDNVIVGDYGEVIVLDWGLAKELDGGDDSSATEPEGRFAKADETLQGDRLGTPAYMAPEQALGEVARIGYASDVYGLAAILYEILTGGPPFRGKDIAAVLAAVVHDAPELPRDLVPDVPRELEAICMRGLAKRPEDRQRSVAELAAQVEGWLSVLAERKRTLEERERFFDLSVDLLAIVGELDRFEQANAAWTRLLGWSASERDAAGLLALVVPEDRPLAEQALARAWVGLQHGECEVRMATAAGGSRWIHWNIDPIPKEAALYLVGRDVTERKQAERELQGLIESAPDAMCVIDSSATIVRVNGQLERLFGHSREDLLGGPIEALVPEPLRERHKGHVARYVAAPTLRAMGSGLQLYGQKRDGSTIPIEISLSPVPLENRLLIMCAIRVVDHHNRKRTNE